MTQDEIIRMAREAGTEANQETHSNFLEFLGRFAEIVCDDLITRQKAMDGVQMAGCDTPYDKYTLEPLYYKEQLEAAIEATREKAAKVCEERGHCNECGGGSEYAAAIRSMK